MRSSVHAHVLTCVLSHVHNNYIDQRAINQVRTALGLRGPPADDVPALPPACDADVNNRVTLRHRDPLAPRPTRLMTTSLSCDLEQVIRVQTDTEKMT